MLRKERNSNIEVLRIVAMLLIVMEHYVSHGLFGLGSMPGYSVDRYIAGLGSTGSYGNAIFVLISGYYMCESRFTGRKLARLWGEMVFYSVVCLGVFSLLNTVGFAGTLASLNVEFGIEQIVHAILPIGYTSYWFVSCYVVLMMIAPLLNMVLERLSRQQLLVGLAAATIFWSIIPTLTNTEYYGNNLTWFCLLYLYAGYVRRYVTITGDWKRHAVLAGLSYLGWMISVIGMIYAGHVLGSDRLINRSNHFGQYNSPFVLLFGVELLLVVIQMRPRHSHWINRVGSATFGVYLIHNNYYVKPFLWKYLLGLPESVYDTGWLVPHLILSVLAVFSICTALDLLRQATVEQWYVRMIDRMWPLLRRLYQNIMDRMTRAIDHMVQ